jgi:hypothetical protein
VSLEGQRAHSTAKQHLDVKFTYEASPHVPKMHLLMKITAFAEAFKAGTTIRQAKSQAWRQAF